MGSGSSLPLFLMDSSFYELMGAENGLGLSSWGSGRAPTFSKGHMRIAILILAFAATPAWAGWDKAATALVRRA